MNYDWDSDGNKGYLEISNILIQGWMIKQLSSLNLFISHQNTIRQQQQQQQQPILLFKSMKNLQQPNIMGSSNQPLTLPPISLPPIQKPPSSHSRDLSKRSQSRLSQHTDHLPDSLITTVIDGHRTQFTLSPKSQQLIIKCTNLKTNKKFITHYKHQLLPKAIQITYKSLEQLFEDIKYIVQDNISNRLAIGQDGKVVFSLQTKKRGRSQFLPQVFELQQESEEKVVGRLQEEVSRLKQQDAVKTGKMNELEQRVAGLERLVKELVEASCNNNNNSNKETPTTGLLHYQPQQQQFSTIPSPMNTIEASMSHMHTNSSIISQQYTSQQRPSQQGLQQQSIIRKFKRTKSNPALQQIKQWQQGEIRERKQQSQNNLLKTQIDNYDCFFQYQPDIIKLQLLSRSHAKLYKCLITPQTIPKSVYSFIPTPKHLFDQLSYIISRHIPNRLSIVDTSFVYRASINAKDQQVLIDGVFETFELQKNDLQRIEELVEMRTGELETRVRELKLEVELLKVSLESNDIIVERPQGFMDSKIVDNLAQFITLLRFFKSKIFKLSLLYRASQNNFQIKKFHDCCDSIPNTLAIVLTQYNKIIGGFTSEQWDRNGNGKSISDYQSHSFIFSLTNRHKFTLEQHEHAIQTSAEDGPRFGNGADLVIKDKANQNNNSYANICTSYTHPRYIYKNSESYKYFSGDDKTNRFSVKEWEVFEVFFEE